MMRELITGNGWHGRGCWRPCSLALASVLAQFVGLGALLAQDANQPPRPSTPTSTTETDIATPAATESTQSTLGDKQAIIRDRVGRLEDRMFELSKALKKAEPEHAAKLVKALGASRSLSVRSKMDEIVAKLTAERLSDAADQQKVVAADLDQLLQLLMEEDDKSAERKKEMDRIKAAKEALNKIIAEQEKERADALAAAAAERTADALEVLAEKVRGLLEKQRTVTEQSEKSQGDGAAAAKAAGDQSAVRRDTEKLAEKLNEADALTPTATDPQGGQPANNQANPRGEGGEKSGESPGESPKGRESQQGQPGEQGNPSESQGSQSGGKPSESGDAAESRNAAKQAGEKTREAAEKMESAEKALRDGKAGTAKSDQQAAEKKLEEAADRLDAQAKAIRNKLKLEEDAKRQRETKDKTKQLAEDMKAGDQKGEGEGESREKSDGEKGGESGKEGGEEGGKSGESGSEQGGESGGEQGGEQGQKQDGQKGGQQGGQQGGEQQEQPMPGQQDIEGALPLQEDAADQLDKKKPDEAAKKQEQALQRLKQAKEQMEDVLDQMRKEQQEQLLAALEARFRAMLAQQLEVNKGTQTLAGIGAANWKRSDQLELAELSRKQKWVGDQADQTLQILVEEGTTVVFPQIIEQVRDDGREVAGRIGTADVGAGVQAAQAELEQAIRDLLAAVKKMQEELQQQDQQGGGGGGGNQPLLPGSAELKLLRSCQLRVNSSTETLQSDKLRPEVPSADIVSRLEKLEKRQEEVSKMAKELHESLNRAQ